MLNDSFSTSNHLNDSFMWLSVLNESFRWCQGDWGQVAMRRAARVSAPGMTWTKRMRLVAVAAP